MSFVDSKVCKGTTSHTRFSPIKRTFNYGLSYILINLNEEEKLKKLPFFKKNTTAFFSVNDKNYLNPGPEPIQKKLNSFMKNNAPNIAYSQALLLTCPIFFGFNFNPVSFFTCLMPIKPLLRLLRKCTTHLKKNICTY